MQMAHEYQVEKKGGKKDLAERQSLLASAHFTSPASAVAWQHSLVCSANRDTGTQS